MNFVTSTILGVNYSDFSQNTFTLYDYVNPPVNLSHVMYFLPITHSYQHNGLMQSENRVKFSIQFQLINNSCVYWHYDERTQMESDFKRISEICSNTYPK